MREILTISIGSKLKKQITAASKKYKVSKSELVKNALEKYLASEEFYSVREKLIPYAARKDYLTDDDIYNDKSL